MSGVTAARADPGPCFSTTSTATVRVQDDLFRHVNGSLAGDGRDPGRQADGRSVHRSCGTRPRRPYATSSPPWTPTSRAPMRPRSPTSTPASWTRTPSRRPGATPLAPLLAEIDAVEQHRPTWPGCSGRFARPAVTGLVGIDTESDPGDPDALRDVRRPGRDRAARRGVLPAGQLRRDPRRSTASTSPPTLELAGIDDPTAEATAVLELETDIAATHWDKVRCRDLRQMYNLTTLEDFAAAAPGLHWREFLAGRRHRRDGDGRAGLDAAVLLHRGVGPADRRPAAGLAVVGPLEGGQLAGALPVARRSSTRTSASTAPCCPARPRCASGGSAASAWSRARSVRRSARSTSTGTSPRSPRRGWTTWSAT